MKAFRDMTEPEIREYLRLLATATESVLPEGPSKAGRALFVLLIFDDDHIGQYISNANRADIIVSLREFADVLEAREDVLR